MSEHKLPPYLLTSTIRVLVAGCGGTGSAVTGLLPYLHQAMVAFGHAGLRVTVADGDRITGANSVRQPFSRSEVGLFKCVVLVNRINLFWGFNWRAFPERLCPRHSLKDFDVVLGCVDSRASRAVIHKLVTAKQSRVLYWLDLGNTETGGQYILGQPLNPATRGPVWPDTRQGGFVSVDSGRANPLSVPSERQNRPGQSIPEST
jgi:PRTRC genetic system ThiF family protein